MEAKKLRFREVGCSHYRLIRSGARKYIRGDRCPSYLTIIGPFPSEWHGSMNIVLVLLFEPILPCTLDGV